jgi:DNA-binding transcriptional regulator YiaG
MSNPIREWRERFCLTQRQAAKRLGVSVNTVINWETDSAVPDKGHRAIIVAQTGWTREQVAAWIAGLEA